MSGLTFDTADEEEVERWLSLSFTLFILVNADVSLCSCRPKMSSICKTVNTAGNQLNICGSVT